MSYFKKAAEGGGGGDTGAGFKGFSFSFSAAVSSTGTEQTVGNSQETASSKGPTASASPAPFAFTGNAGASHEGFAFSTASLQDGTLSEISRDLFKGVPSLEEQDTFEGKKRDSHKEGKCLYDTHALKERSFSGVDPCPPWKGVMATNPHYPIPMMGETKKRAAEDCRDVDVFKCDQPEWPFGVNDIILTKDPATLYLAGHTEAAIASLRKMTKLDVMKALSFESHFFSTFSTMVHVAAYRCDLETLKTLVELTGPAVLLVQDGMGGSPLAGALRSPLMDTGEAIGYLLDNYPDDLFEDTDFRGRSILYQAVKSGRLERVQAVVERHPRTDWMYLCGGSQIPSMGSPIITQVSMLTQSEPILIYLYHALPHDVFFWRDKNGENLVHSLCVSSFSAFKALYNEAGPEMLKEETFAGKTVLHIAAEAGSVQLIQFLLEEMDEEDICKKCKARGALALHYAVRRRHFDDHLHLEVVHMLAAAMPPAMRFEPDFSGYSAMQLAEEIDASKFMSVLTNALAINITKGAM